MRTVVSALVILFGLVHIFMAVVQFECTTDGRPSIVMFFGSVAMIAGALEHFAGGGDVLPALTGCVLVCIAAYANGRLSGTVHLSHHTVRGAAAVLLTAGLFIW